MYLDTAVLIICVVYYLYCTILEWINTSPTKIHCCFNRPMVQYRMRTRDLLCTVITNTIPVFPKHDAHYKHILGLSVLLRSLQLGSIPEKSSEKLRPLFTPRFSLFATLRVLTFSSLWILSRVGGEAEEAGWSR